MAEDAVNIELNHSDHQKTCPTDAVAIVLSSGCFLGYAPVASGTVGSLPVALLYGFFPLVFEPAVSLVVWILIFFTGVWSSSRCERIWGKDPSRVVIDEIVGMGLAFVFLPLNWTIVIAVFFLFRFFDIIKPPPLRLLERLPSGWGIMADDAAAGVYTNIVLQVAVRLLNAA